MPAWEHDHNNCPTPPATPKVKAYDDTTRRYAIRAFKTHRHVEAVTGNELAAEARCIALNRSWGGKQDFYYIPSPKQVAA